MPGVTGELVSGAFADPAHVHYVADWQEAADYTAPVARDGDYVITLGCGNVYQIIPQVLEALERTAPSQSAPASRGSGSRDAAADAPSAPGAEAARGEPEAPRVEARDLAAGARRAAMPGPAASADAARSRAHGADSSSVPKRRASRWATLDGSGTGRTASVGGASRRCRARLAGGRRTGRSRPAARRLAREPCRRKALRAEVRRFTVRARRRRAVGSAPRLPLLLVLGSLGAAYSPLFAVENITVVGARAARPGRGRGGARRPGGHPAPARRRERGQSGALAFPLIETYSLEARPPHDLVVRVVERTPDRRVRRRPASRSSTPRASHSRRRRRRPRASRCSPSRRHRLGAFTAVGLVLRSLPAPIRRQVTAVSATRRTT